MREKKRKKEEEKKMGQLINSTSPSAAFRQGKGTGFACHSKGGKRKRGRGLAVRRERKERKGERKHQPRQKPRGGTSPSLPIERRSSARLPKKKKKKVVALLEKGQLEEKEKLIRHGR